MHSVLLAIATLLAVTLLAFAWASVREEEGRAARVSLMLAIVLPAPLLGAAFLSGAFGIVVQVGLLAGLIGLAMLLWLPVGNDFPVVDDVPKTQIDERDIMFSRKRLVPGTERFEAYYVDREAHRVADDNIRALPGLLSPGSTLFDPVAFAAADAAFDAVAAFHPQLDAGSVSDEAVELEPAAISRFLTEWIGHMGAVSVGFAELKPYHLYHTIGRGDRYGEPNNLDHGFAIAFTLEMDKRFTDRAPRGPTVMESARQYLNSGSIAVVVAHFLQKLGYPARAHIDGSYRVVCPLVARDAGLGEIGRMGILMTPELGPRVRIAVVTTDLPLLATGREPDPTMTDFCVRCKKCAEACPSGAIPRGDREVIDGAVRWQIDSEACFKLWNTIGTDCARCMSVCPYSHPDTFFHGVVRAATRRSAPARVAALRLDDLFYGRKPVPLDTPEWMDAIAGASPA